MGQRLTLWPGGWGSVYAEAKARPADMTGSLCAQATGLQLLKCRCVTLSKSRMPTNPQTTAQVPPAVRESAVAWRPQMDSPQRGFVEMGLSLS